MVSSKSLGIINSESIVSPNSKRSLTRTFSDTQFSVSNHAQDLELQRLKEAVLNYKSSEIDLQKQVLLVQILDKTQHILGRFIHQKSLSMSTEFLASSPEYLSANEVYITNIYQQEPLQLASILNFWKVYEESVKKITLGNLYINEYLKMERERILHQNDADETYDVMDKITATVQKNLQTLIFETLGQQGVDTLESKKVHLQDINKNYNLQLDQFSQNVCFARLSGTPVPKLPEKESILFPELLHLSLVNKIDFCLHALDLEESNFYTQFNQLRNYYKDSKDALCLVDFCCDLSKDLNLSPTLFPEGFESLNPEQKTMFYVKHLLYEAFISPFRAIYKLPITKLLELISQKKSEENFDFYRSSRHYDSQFKDLNVLYSQEADPAVWSHPEVALTFLSRTIVDILLDSTPITRARLPETLCPFRTDLIELQSETQRLLSCQVTWLSSMPFLKKEQRISFDNLYLMSKESSASAESLFSLISFDVEPENHDTLQNLLEKNLNPDSPVYTLVSQRFKQFLNSAILEPYRYEQGQPKSPRKIKTYNSSSWLTKIAKAASASMQITWHTYNTFYNKQHVSTLNHTITTMVLNPPENLNWMTTQMKEELAIMKSCRTRYIDIKVATVFTTAFLNEKAGIWDTITISDEDFEELSEKLKPLSQSKESVVEEFAKFVEKRLPDISIPALAPIAEDQESVFSIEDTLQFHNASSAHTHTPFQQSPSNQTQVNRSFISRLLHEFKSKLRKTLGSKQARLSAFRDLQAQLLYSKSSPKDQVIKESSQIAATIKNIKIQFPLKPSLYMMLRSGLGPMKTS